MAVSTPLYPIDRGQDVRVLRPRRAAPADALRPTRAEVNLEALRHNLSIVRRCAGRAEVWAVMKADGYGHGAAAVARTLERSGAGGFCVALLEEAIELREAGIAAPILVMGGYYGGAYSELIARRLTPVVYDRGQLEEFARLVKSGDCLGPVEVHLKVDTGMARLGVTMEELPSFATILGRFPEVQVRGLMTHLACADALTPEETAVQMARFDEATAVLHRAGIRPLIRHAANSAALLRTQGLHELVRPGIALFGVSPRAGGRPDPAMQALTNELRPVMRVRTEVVALREIEEGTNVGYGAFWKASRRSKIATIPMGYADGLSRQLSNRGHAIIRGKRAPIVGAMSMDMAMIDVTDLEGVALRDEAVLLGAQEGPLGKDRITADELAVHGETIPWEIVTSISRRVPRFYREP